MSSIDILNQFKLTMISFLDELIEHFSDVLISRTKADLIIFRIFLKDQIDVNTVMSMFIQKALPYKEMISNRNEDFFLSHCSLLDSMNYSDANKNRLNYFKTLWASEKIDDDDKKAIWEWFDTFVFLSEKYLKVSNTE
jgi:hypothetical protein